MALLLKSSGNAEIDYRRIAAQIINMELNKNIYVDALDGNLNPGTYEEFNKFTIYKNNQEIDINLEYISDINITIYDYYNKLLDKNQDVYDKIYNHYMNLLQDINIDTSFYEGSIFRMVKLKKKGTATDLCKQHPSPKLYATTVYANNIKQKPTISRWSIIEFNSDFKDKLYSYRYTGVGCKIPVKGGIIEYFKTCIYNPISVILDMSDIYRLENGSYNLNYPLFYSFKNVLPEQLYIYKGAPFESIFYNYYAIHNEIKYKVDDLANITLPQYSYYDLSPKISKVDYSKIEDAYIYYFEASTYNGLDSELFDYKANYKNIEMLLLENNKICQLNTPTNTCFITGGPVFDYYYEFQFIMTYKLKKKKVNIICIMELSKYGLVLNNFNTKNIIENIETVFKEINKHQLCIKRAKLNAFDVIEKISNQDIKTFLIALYKYGICYYNTGNLIIVHDFMNNVQYISAEISSTMPSFSPVQSAICHQYLSTIECKKKIIQVKLFDIYNAIDLFESDNTQY